MILLFLNSSEKTCRLDFSEGHTKPLLDLIRSWTSQTFMVNVKYPGQMWTLTGFDQGRLAQRALAGFSLPDVNFLTPSVYKDDAKN